MTVSADVSLWCRYGLSRNVRFAARIVLIRVAGTRNSASTAVRPRSVLRHLGIDPFGPGVDAAGEVVDFGEARLAQEVDGLGAASAHLAVDDDLAVGVEFADALGQIVRAE